MRCASGRNVLRRWCGSYKHVDYSRELGDMELATRNLPAQSYFAEASTHRFCLNAPGSPQP